MAQMRSENRGRVFILSANSSEKNIKRIMEKLDSFKWVYFGKDTPCYYKINKFTNSGQSIDVGGLINRVAREVKDEFINFDKNISFSSRPHFWYATDVAEKNPYASDFFYNCCALIVFQEIIANEAGNLIILCEDLYLGLLIKQIILKNNHDIKMFWRSGYFMFSCEPIIKTLYNFYIYALTFYQRIRFISLWVIRKNILRKYGTNSKNKYLLNSDKPPEILLTLWADINTFKDKKYLDKETYFGTLPLHIRASGKSIGYIACPVYWICRYEDIVKASTGVKELVIFPEQCLNLFNALYITIFTLFHPAKLGKPIIIFGINITELFFNELRKEKSKRAQLERLEFYFVGQYLKSVGIKPKKVIHLYENQAWEKTLRLGIKKYSPQTELVGYQHTPFPALYINYFPSLRDINSSQIPDKIITIGKKHRDIFMEHKYFASTLIDGPALRFDYIFRNNRMAMSGTKPSFERKVILVACSISYLESFEIAYKTVDALKNHDEHDIYIKLHPKMNKAKQFLSNILECLSMQQLPAHIKLVNDSIEDILPKVSVLFCNFTAVAYEAIALNIPVVFIQSDIWFDMDELEWFQEASFRAKTGGEILEALSKIGNYSQINLEKRSYFFKKIITESFNKPSADLIKRFYC